MSKEKYLNYINSEKEELAYLANEKRQKIFGDVITFSRNVFVPVTHQCRNRCGYCSFVSDSVESWITPKAFEKLLVEAKKEKVIEVLLTLGEKPEEKYLTAKKFLEKFGFNTTVEYVKSFCDKALESSLLPHSNLGILSYEELKLLKESNASLGLMLETTSERMMTTVAHKLSQGKNPSLRLETIRNAGRLNIPFTSGILVGIGEDWMERIDSLLELRKISNKYHHIQEIIVQNFNPQLDTPMSNFSPPTDEETLLSVSLARLILPSTVNIQIPPNLNKNKIVQAINHGANDLGGISPLSIDYINPNMHWQNELELTEELKKFNFILHKRLPVYPSYERYLNSKIRDIIRNYHADEKTISTNH